MNPIQNPRLTAEQVFAANEKDRPHVNGTIDFCFDQCAPPPINAGELTHAELIRLWGLRRIHQMAALALYPRQCGGSNQDVDRIAAQFEQLPDDVQAKALAHETAAIMAVKPYDDNQMQIHIPGGFGWFCKLERDNLAKGEGENIAMFTTAAEMERESLR